VTTTLLYDGSLNGLMTVIFTIYNRKIKSPIITVNTRAQNDLFKSAEYIITDSNKAKRVLKRFKSLSSSNDYQQIYCAFLSEIIGIENIIYEYLKMTFIAQKTPTGDYGNTIILKIAQAAKMVNREKHRMKAFVRFHLIDRETYYANVEPDFNVLPLIINHFKNRYADQKWIIYDLKRNYGIIYNLETVQEVIIDFNKTYRQRGISNIINENHDSIRTLI